MIFEKISAPKLRETYFRGKHESGLDIIVIPKKQTTLYALFATRYGSVDNKFRTEKEKDFHEVPAGVAHFLEHKLFENSNGEDTFLRFSRLGASANAFTSNDVTAYLFSATENYAESLEELVRFVSDPYFTPETVEKEMGIIEQELRMYEDNPHRALYENMLLCLYENHPVRISVGGTVETIREITPEILYNCYNTFYNLSNMALAVAGNVTVEQVLAIADKVLKDEAPVKIEQIIPDEPDEVVTDYTEEIMNVDIPKFAIGFKENRETPVRTAKETVCANILLDIIAGKVSPLYEKMLSEGLINPSFGNEYFIGRGFSVPMFIGESDNPEKVRDLICERIDELRKAGISEEDFEISKNDFFARVFEVPTNEPYVLFEVSTATGSFVSKVRQTVFDFVTENAAIDKNNYILNFRTFGSAKSNMCVIIDVVGSTQEIADTICSLARSRMLHCDFEGRKSTAGNIAFPFSPSDIHMGEVYEFSIFHLAKVASLCETSVLKTEEVGK